MWGIMVGVMLLSIIIIQCPCLCNIHQSGQVVDDEGVAAEIAGAREVEVNGVAAVGDVAGAAVGGHADLLEGEVGVPHVGEAPKGDLRVGVQNFVLSANRHNLDKGCDVRHGVVVFFFFS